MLARVLEPEQLDHLPADDPAAQRARRDLRRVNAAMGARRILGRALERALPDRRGLRLLEIGCGDGRLLLDVAKHRGERWPDARVDLLDRAPVVDAATIAAYATCGWRARSLAADVLDWARAADVERWDAVVANLFLHHFDGDALGTLLAGCARRADVLVACEPRRSRFALAASHLIVFLGANAVTRHDGVVSVRAGFVGAELTAAWPERGDAWRLDEYDDGAFTHCFCAVRRRGGA
ncbi:MAG: methyltransferase domain-containing protein [Rhizobacter sp.]|nr:methyltransferase domain-containing protein [Rhizobacter sp.]